jgi:hypothetical protein
MDKVVYILGAGFSAPLGIPTMGNFLFKSKDLYFSDTAKYAHFKLVFDRINELSITKNYYNSDLFNIEEILSILEMDEFLAGDQLKREFISYIKDVIQHYTPEHTDISGNLPGNWQDFLTGRDTYSLYGYFVANLMNLKFRREESDRIHTNRVYDFVTEKEPDPPTKYSVLSLNYDMVLENAASSINKLYLSEDDIQFEKDFYDSEWNSSHLAKLHGCLSNEEIVPPTWAKGTHQSIIPIWKNAFKLLGDANHIRFLGYSLPVADSYIKYLLKAAVINTPHLKSLDVICLDNDGLTKSRYDEFFQFTNYRFKNGSITDYFLALKKQTNLAIRNNRNDNFVRASSLEQTHDIFMSNT